MGEQARVIVHVRFRDSHHSYAGWEQHNEEWDLVNNHIVEAVGFILEESPDWLLLGQALSSTHSLGRLAIPTSAIIEKNYLEPLA